MAFRQLVTRFSRRSRIWETHGTRSSSCNFSRSCRDSAMTLPEQSSWLFQRLEDIPHKLEEKQLAAAKEILACYPTQLQARWSCNDRLSPSAGGSARRTWLDPSHQWPPESQKPSDGLAGAAVVDLGRSAAVVPVHTLGLILDTLLGRHRYVCMPSSALVVHMLFADSQPAACIFHALACPQLLKCVRLQLPV